MPDFERPLRKLQIRACRNIHEQEVVTAYHKGLDRARKEVAVIAAIIAPIIVWLIV